LPTPEVGPVMITRLPFIDFIEVLLRCEYILLSHKPPSLAEPAWNITLYLGIYRKFAGVGPWKI
jgi:hypothetical protein